MKLLRLIYNRETIAPIFALTFASATGVLLVSVRVVWTGNLHYAFLVWNLFLAWLPLLFAMLAREAHREGRTCWRFFSFSAAWLLFFPNAPYIFTDVIHLMYGRYQHFWVDLMMILLCALTGLVLGFVSLYLMQSVVTRTFGRVAGWFFVATAAGLCSVGIFLGRFLRFNSWDVILRPGKIYHGLDAWADGRMMNGSSAAFLLLVATFLFITYVMLYALTHLQPTHLMPAEIANGKAANS